MTTSLRSRLGELADSFANAVVDAIRSSSLEDLQAEASGSHRAAQRQPASDQKIQRGTAPRAKGGRLPRRSAEDIAQVLDQVVALVKKNREGLRAEQIREQLNVQAKELPRVLKEGLGKRKLKSRGQKRATTYFAS